ncbi:MAG: Mut7-C RNAse domain-containing protein, partial [Candidatus Krumholzibacteriota bacterium]
MMLIFQKDLGSLIPPAALVYPRETGKPALVRRHLAAPSSLKDIIESVGVPHCEIGTVVSLASGLELPLDTLTSTGDVLAVAGAQPRPLESPRFLCDGHLGKLALLLRIMGFDSAWDDSWSEPGMARRGINENRTVLTRSRSLLKRSSMDNAMLIRSDVPDTQAGEVLRRFLLVDQVRLFGRCSKCNGLLREVAKADVAARIPLRTAKWLDTYYLCRECDHLFWEGT